MTILSEATNLRYERKFYTQDLPFEEVENIIKTHPAVFSEIYEKRFVNNIYLDSFDMHSYLENKNGVSRRHKLRIRWYGNLFGKVENPYLEVKIKHNMHVGKIQYPLQSLILDEGFTFTKLCEIIDASEAHDSIKLQAKSSQCSLLNRYARKYYLSVDKKFRLTLDHRLKYYRIDPFVNNFLQEREDKQGIVIEIKYSDIHNDEVDTITKFFPFRVSRNSKYVSGVESVS